MCGSPNTNRTGLHARNCWRRLAHIAKPVAPTRSRSVLNALLRFVTSCNGVSRRCRLDSKARCLCLRCLEVRPSIGFVSSPIYPFVQAPKYKRGRAPDIALAERDDVMAEGKPIPVPALALVVLGSQQDVPCAE